MLRAIWNSAMPATRLRILWQVHLFLLGIYICSDPLGDVHIGGTSPLWAHFYTSPEWAIVRSAFKVYRDFGAIL